MVANKNTLEKKEYLWGNLFWCVLSMFWYRKLLFRCLPQQTLFVSKMALWGFVLALIILGTAFTYRAHRNYVSVAVNILTPYGIYFLATYKSDMPIFAMAILIAALLLSACFLVLVLTAPVKNSSRKKAILKKRTQHGFLGVRIIIGLCLTLLMIPTAISSIFGNSIFIKKTSAAPPERASEYTIANNIEAVAKFEESKWNKLSAEEKLDVSQIIANIEMRYLGLPHELNVVAGRLRESTVACYNDADHSITVNIDYLDSSDAEEMLDSLCHEAYHAYQHRLIDAYDDLDAEYQNLLTFYDAKIYKKEFADYADGKDDPVSYYSQSCERDARAYAREAVSGYYERIDKYLAGNVAPQNVQ